MINLDKLDAQVLKFAQMAAAGGPSRVSVDVGDLAAMIAVVRAALEADAITHWAKQDGVMQADVYDRTRKARIEWDEALAPFQKSHGPAAAPDSGKGGTDHGQD